MNTKEFITSLQTLIEATTRKVLKEEIEAATRKIVRQELREIKSMLLENRDMTVIREVAQPQYAQQYATNPIPVYQGIPAPQPAPAPAPAAPVNADAADRERQDFRRRYADQLAKNINIPGLDMNPVDQSAIYQNPQGPPSIPTQAPAVVAQSAQKVLNNVPDYLRGMFEQTLAETPADKWQENPYR